MFSRKKIAAVAGLLGSLVVTCMGAGQAHATGGPGSCTRDILGNITCIQLYEGVMPGGDLYALRQAQTCVPIEPVAPDAVRVEDLADVHKETSEAVTSLAAVVAGRTDIAAVRRTAIREIDEGISSLYRARRKVAG